MNSELKSWDTGDNAKNIDQYWRGSPFEIALHQQIADLIVDVIGRQAEVFEVGCGSGMIYEYLKGRMIYHCGDVSESFRKLAKERYPELDPMYVDIHQLPFGDMELPNVININVLQHLPYYEKPVQELIRVARKKVLIVTWGTGKDRKRDRLGKRKVFTDIFYDNCYNISKLVGFCRSQPRVSKVSSFYIKGSDCCIQIEKEPCQS
jgi:ubiquinone/menaquinone biosynthesis C-methylase UbiE